MKNNKNKLSLKSETIRTLTVRGLVEVIGGAATIDTWTNPTPPPRTSRFSHSC